MKLWRILLFALMLPCLSLPLMAQQSIVLDNNDGDFMGTSISSGDLSLNSTLTQISGFMGDLSGYNTQGSNLGTLSFTTGALMAGESMVPLTGQTSTFAPGGGFMIADTFNGGYGGFTFSGVFQTSNWMCDGTCTKISKNEWTGLWSFVGSLAPGATLTVDGQNFTATDRGLSRSPVPLRQ
jgi:hypothetical protein